MEYSIIVTNEANLMLEKHIKFLSKVSINAAINLKILIKESLIILKHFPRIGYKLKRHKKLPTYYRKLVISKRYIIIYYIYKDIVYIQSILDSRQNNKKYLF